MENKNKSALKTVSFMMAATVLSKLLGFLRNVLLAASYGTGNEATAFSAASRIPLSFFDIFFGSAILGCFVPVYNSLIKYKEHPVSKERIEDHGDADAFSCVFLNFILLVTGILCFFGIIFSDTVIALIASELDGETFRLASRLLKIMLPMICLAGTSYTLVGVLQSKGNFIVPAVISAISNTCVILYFLIFDGIFGITGLAAAYLISWVMQFVTLAVPLMRMGFRPRLTLDLRTPGFLHSMRMAPKVMAGSWLIPFSVLIGLDFALRSGSDGAVPSFEYANTLFTMAAGILTHSICNYAFPSLSEKASHNEDKAFAQDASKALFTVIALIIPFATALYILAPNVISVLYMRGSFDIDSCLTVSGVFTAMVPAMISFAVIEIMSRCFYALDNGIIPAIASLGGIAVNYISSYVFISVLGKGVSYVGVSFALSLTFSATVFIIAAAIRIKGLFTKEYLTDMIKLIVSAMLSAAVMILIKLIFGIDHASSGFLLNLSYCAVTLMAGIISYLLFSKVMKEKLISEFISVFTSRLLK